MTIEAKARSEKGERYHLHLEFDQVPKALNRMLRSHYHKNNQSNKAWDFMVAMECARLKPREPLQKASLTLIRHSHRFLDYDGLVGSMKPVVDALVSAQVIIDDSWAVTGAWQVTQMFRPKKDGSKLVVIVDEIIYRPIR